MFAQGRILREVLVVHMDRQLEEIALEKYGQKISKLGVQEVYIVVVCLVKRLIDTFIQAPGEKRLYYISSNFEKRKFLENNLYSLGIDKLLEKILESKGHSLTQIEAVEQEYIGTHSIYGKAVEDFFQAMAQTRLPGEAIGIRTIRRYEDRENEVEDWEREKSWLRREDIKFQLSLNHVKAQAVLYSMEVPENREDIYKYRIFDLEVEEGISEEEKNIYYKYFLVSSAVRMILMQMREKKYDLRKLYQYAAIRFDDQYLSLVIPELLRILVEEKAIPIKEALEIVKKTCGYETYESMIKDIKKCPREYVDILVPQLIEKLEELSI